MNKLLSGLQNETNRTTTENGATAFKSTKSSVLDFFAVGASMRGLGEQEHVNYLSNAWLENPELAFKCMFYARDVRGGQGQRDAFRNQLRFLAGISPETLRANLNLIPVYGRWDDLYSLFDTEVEGDVLALFRTQLMKDMGNPDTPSLLAKWLKSENASSPVTKYLASKTRKYLKFTPAQYRKVLSTLRNTLNIVERDMSKCQWSEIEYPHVPSQAMMKYRNAFKRNDGARFTTFVEKVNSGEEKINADTLYPYQIVEKVTGYWGQSQNSNIDPKLAQAMWDNLPDYVDGSDGNAIAVVDTSGSMSGDPINVAVSLGMYFAERNKGAFKDHFITFNTNPELMQIAGKDFVSKVRKIGQAPWGGSTNLEATFELILRTAIDNEVPAEDMPTKLFIISDMQFNCVSGGKDETLYHNMKRKFNQAGYEAPQVVFWNVRATANPNQPVTMDERGVQLVSGLSPSIFQYIMGGAFQTPYELMVDVLNSERYEPLTIVG